MLPDPLPFWFTRFRVNWKTIFFAGHDETCFLSGRVSTNFSRLLRYFVGGRCDLCDQPGNCQIMFNFPYLRPPPRRIWEPNEFHVSVWETTRWPSGPPVNHMTSCQHGYDTIMILNEHWFAPHFFVTVHTVILDFRVKGHWYSVQTSKKFGSEKFGQGAKIFGSNFKIN